MSFRWWALSRVFPNEVRPGFGVAKREEHRVYNCLKMMRAERERERALKCSEGNPDEKESSVLGDV